MTQDKANKISLACKLLFAAGFGFLLIANPFGAIISALMAYCWTQCYSRPFTTFKESLRVNWRGFCFMGGILGMAVFYLVTKNAEANIVLVAFQAGFIGVLMGELVQKIVQSYVKADGQDGGADQTK